MDIIFTIALDTVIVYVDNYSYYMGIIIIVIA